MVRSVIIFLVREYQKVPHPPMCKYTPSCSAYMILAVEKYGSVRGFFKGIWRLLRCNPFSKGGVDYP